MTVHEPSESLKFVLDQAQTTFAQLADDTAVALAVEEIGRVTALGQGIAHVSGLPRVKSEELLQFPGGELGIAFNLDEDDVGVVMLDDSAALQAGCEVQRTQRVMDVPVGEELLGRVVDAMGRALDDRGAISAHQRWPIEREAPPIMARAPVSVPLQTGIKVIDALIPIGRGQRELIVGDRQTGKTELAIDIILNQRDQNVICIYCAIAQRGAAVAKLVADLRQREVMDYCVVVAAGGESPAGLQYITPFAATTIAEYFMAQGRDVLIVYDDLIQHARAYRELSLLLRRPPGREAFPGDIFYLHARLLERATHLGPDLGGGSLTALPIVATEAQNLSAYIPTNLVSITDGQIVLTPELFQKGIFPAVDVGTSVSRVGGKVQLPAYRAVVGDLRLSYAQFQELEVFARFGTRLDDSTRTKLARGRRVREVLKQAQHELLPVAEQIALLLALNQGLLDEVPLDKMEMVQQQICQVVRETVPDVCQRIQTGEALTEGDRKALLETVELTLASKLEEHHANP